MSTPNDAVVYMSLKKQIDEKCLEATYEMAIEIGIELSLEAKISIMKAILEKS